MGGTSGRGLLLMITEDDIRQVLQKVRAGRWQMRDDVLALCETVLAWKAERDELVSALQDRMAVESEDVSDE